MVIDYVVPDYHASRPKACMGGWAQRIMNISPAGLALPCHAAETLPGFIFPNVRDHSLAWIWAESDAFRRYRSTDWMPEPCRSCDRKEIDWGGCRCQAFALLGDAGATDPACALSPDHHVMAEAALEAPSRRRISSSAASERPSSAQRETLCWVNIVQPGLNAFALLLIQLIKSAPWEDLNG